MGKGYGGCAMGIQECTMTIFLAAIVLVIAYLAAARWLQQRSTWITPHAEVDAVYVVAGAPSRSERMDALLDWIRRYDCAPATILIPEDRTSGLHRSPRGNLVSVAQSRLERLRSAYPSSTIPTRIAGHTVAVVPAYQRDRPCAVGFAISVTV